MFVRILVVIGVAIGGSALWAGHEYYLLPLASRPFSPLHDLYAPTGLIGQGFGIIGTAMIAIGVTLYMLRKRVRFLARFGKLKDWLHFHIFLCLLGPFLVLLHTTFKFQGLVSISFWSMALVVASGVFGRYVYVWLPKTMNGRFLGAEEIRKQMSVLLERMESQFGVTAEQLGELRRAGGPMAPSVDRRSKSRGTDRRGRARPELGVFSAIADSVKYRLGRRRERTRLTRGLESAGVPEPARSRVVVYLEEQRRIEQQLRMMQPFRRAFRYWHAFHLPLAIVMAVVLVGHVGVAIAFGYTWIF